MSNVMRGFSSPTGHWAIVEYRGGFTAGRVTQEDGFGCDIRVEVPAAHCDEFVTMYFSSNIIHRVLMVTEETARAYAQVPLPADTTPFRPSWVPHEKVAEEQGEDEDDEDDEEAPKC